MAVFGGYETVRELFRSGLASAYTARKAGAEADCYVVKAYEPPPAEIDPQRFQQEVETFLDGARVQKECSNRKAAHWAALHESGTVEGGAYFVTDYQPRSVQHLIRGKAKLDGNALCQIVGSVVRGLIELRDACHRPHGNLKPTNVLLTGKGLADIQILLTDPAGAKLLDPAAGDVPDLHAIGELIYQLVLHRAGRAMGGWPAPESEEWGRLGKKGADWRQLCNRLLNPNLAPGLLRLEDLYGDIQKLRTAGGGLKKVLILLVAVLVLAGGGVGAYMYFGGDGEGGGGGEPAKTFDAQAWQGLCQQWGDWVEPLLGARAEDRLAAWDKDPYLKSTTLAMLKDVAEKGNPKDISGQRWGSVYDQGRVAPPKAKTEKGTRQTAVALAAIEALKESLGSEKWPSLTLASRSAKDFAARGWQGPAAYLNARLGLPKKDVAAWVAEVLSWRDALAKIETRWKKTQQARTVIEGWGEESLKQLGGYVEAATASPPEKATARSLTELADKLDELSSDKGLLTRLAAFIQSERAKKLDMILVRKKPPFELPAGAKLTEDVLRGGLTKLESGGYDVKADPRTAEWKATVEDSLAARRGDVGSLADEVPKQVAALNDQKLKDEFAQGLQGVLGTVGQYRQALDAIKAKVQAVEAPKAYNYDTREAVDTGMREIDAALKDLTNKLAATKQTFVAISADILRRKAGTLKDIQEALRKMKGVSPTSLAEIDSEWVKQRDALLASEKTSEGLFEKSDRLSKFLRGLEALFPQDLGAKLESRPWNAALITGDLDRLRKTALASALGYVTWPKVLAGQADDALAGPRDKLVKSCNDWRAGVVEIVPALNQMQDFLNAGYLLSEKPAAQTATLGEFYASLAAKPVFADPAVQVAAKPIIDRVTAMKQVSALTDPVALLAAASAGKQGQFEAARAAWVQLGKLGKAWPAKSDDLRQEIECRKNLNALYGLVSDPARKAALQKELTDESRHRWEAYFVSRSDPKDIEDAVAKMPGFGFTAADRATLSPLAQFRLSMFDLLYTVGVNAGAVDDDTVKKAVGAFRGKVAALPPAFGGTGNVKALVDQLGEVESDTGGTVDLTQAGPALRGWQKGPDAGDVVPYSWPGHDQKLTFIRVTPKTGKPCFLCVTEVSVGLFLDVVLGSQKQAEMAKLLAKDEDILGPRTWVRKGGELALSDDWLPIVPPALTGKIYPATGVPEKITSLHPVQQVSLAGAVYFAGLMNCRLPTSAEWSAAYEQGKRSASQKPHNLRDKTWLAQKLHDAALEQSGDLVEPERFYPDAGIFWPKGIAAAQKKVGADAEVAPSAATDGYLWFSKVYADPQRAFQSLAGNVAEFVYEDPDALAVLKSPAADAVKQFLGTSGAQAKVIGGSAMSAPVVAVDQPQELTTPAAVEGFSDVGFRLAFFAGREPLQSRVLRLLKGLQNQGYLPPSP